MVIFQNNVSLLEGTLVVVFVQLLIFVIFIPLIFTGLFIPCPTNLTQPFHLLMWIQLILPILFIRLIHPISPHDLTYPIAPIYPKCPTYRICLVNPTCPNHPTYLTYPILVIPFILCIQLTSTCLVYPIYPAYFHCFPTYPIHHPI